MRLAPLYDVTSALPYPSLDSRRIKFAMRIGGEYLVRRVGPIHWATLAGELHLGADAMRTHLIDVATRTPDAIGDVQREAERAGLDHPIIARLETAIVTRARDCLAQLRRWS